MAEGFKFCNNTPSMSGPFAWTNYHMCFAAGSLFRFLAIFWVLGMPEPGAKPLMEAVRELRFNVFGNVRAGGCSGGRAGNRGVIFLFPAEV